MPKTSTGCPRHQPELGSFEKKTKRVTKYRTAECIHQSGSPESAFSNNHSVTYFLTPWDDKTQDTWLHSRLTDCTTALSRREQKVSHRYPRIQSIKVQFTGLLITAFPALPSYKLSHRIVLRIKQNTNHGSQIMTFSRFVGKRDLPCLRRDYGF
ncbi:tumor necrosis factor ligand superfamily member 4 isoform X5 [Homo sapiens]|uniref:tumor necrosis factor ligand superfamily member 4 isoform X5 n=1 Tax=Homo sapiens TaxID=9606 RepID=UPI001FB0A4E8|nr:tumor necrosis factor ligand superfamily member 4 isoform X5 [Homo sapiens]